MVVCGLAAALLWRRARRRDVVIVLVVAVVARALLVPGAPTLSDDAYRFVWDGRVQAAGINPYRHVPADRRLVRLRDWQVFTRVNRPRTRTLYPPADEVAFLAAHEVAGDGMVPWKLSMLALEAAAVALLLLLLSRARVSRGRVVLYAWHPIAVVEIAGSGHPDPIMLVPLLATLLLWDARRRVAAGVALGVAALAKFVPLLAAPFLAASVPVALGGNLNPGSQRIEGHSFLLSAGCLLAGLSPAQALWACTAGAAWVIRLVEMKSTPVSAIARPGVTLAGPG